MADAEALIARDGEMIHPDGPAKRPGGGHYAEELCRSICYAAVDSREYRMKTNNDREALAKRVKRGRGFEQWERSRWTAVHGAAAETEAKTRWKGKRGRVDLTADRS